MAIRAPSLLGFLALTVLLAGCEQPPSEGAIQVTVLSLEGTPLPGALAAIESGGLFLSAYTWGAQAGEEPVDETSTGVPGAFSIVLPRGRHGLHVFEDEYQVASAEVVVEPEGFEYTPFELRAAKMAEDAARPTTQNLTLSPTAARPGEPFTLSVDVAGAPDDPISAQVLVIHPAEGISAALNPPAPPEGEEPVPVDGTWTIELTAPVDPGQYTYHVVASSTAGMTAPILATTLLVE